MDGRSSLRGPGVLAGGMLAFTLSLDDFVVSFFTSGPGSTTLPILIFYLLLQKQFVKGLTGGATKG